MTWKEAERRAGLGVVALWALASGCGGDAPTGPEAEALTAAELEQLVLDDEEFLASFMGDRFSGQASTGPATGLSLAVVPVVTEGEFSWSRTCPGGGLVTVEGAFRREVDREAATAEVWVEGEKAKEGCVHVREDVRITVDAEATFEAHRRWEERALVEGSRSISGEFAYRTSDGRSGSCEFDLQAVWDPENREVHVTGTYCGLEIDRVVSRDDGSA